MQISSFLCKIKKNQGGGLIIDRITTSKTFFALGTANTVTACSEAVGLLEEIKKSTLLLHDKFNIFDEQSEISKLNSNAENSFFKLSPDAYYVIKKSLEISELTGGAFDITCLPLARLWKNVKELPDEKQIRHAKKLVNYHNIIFDNYSLKFKKKGMGIDPCGIVKGYAADRARALLVENGVDEALINFGGTIVAMGDEKVIGIQNPFKSTGNAMGTLRIKNKAVVTSGSYERYITLNNKKYHHIINSATGYPVSNSLVSVTLVGENADELDALATGVFVLGIEKGCKIIEGKALEGIFIFENGQVFVSEGLKNKFEILEEQHEK